MQTLTNGMGKVGGLIAEATISAGTTVTVGTSLIIGTSTFTETEIGYLDGLTLGTVAASKAVTVDAGLGIQSWAVTNTSTAGVKISTSTGTTGSLIQIDSSSGSDSARAMVKMTQSATTATAANVLELVQLGSAAALKITQSAVAGTAGCVNINLTSSAAVSTWLAILSHANAGGAGGDGCGLDLSGLSAAASVFKMPNVAGDVTSAGTNACSAKILVTLASGGTGYIPVYNIP